jgi:hypothetical protein
MFHGPQNHVLQSTGVDPRRQIRHHLEPNQAPTDLPFAISFGHVNCTTLSSFLTVARFQSRYIIPTFSIPADTTCAIGKKSLEAELESVVIRDASMISGPPELQEAIQGGFSYYALPTCGLFKILCDGRKGHGDYTWGFRIYRTTYKRADSDFRFAKAIEILNEYIRYECFSFDKFTEVSDPDFKASEQLWRRVRHEVIEDP